MLFAVKVRKDKTGCLAPQALNLVLPDFRTFRRIRHNLLQFLRRQPQVMDKGKEPMHPAGFWFFFQFLYDFFWCLIGPHFKWPRTINILLVDIQSRVIWVKCRHQIVTSHGSLSHKIDVSGVNLIDVETAVLTAQCVLPLALVAVADNKDNLIATRCVEQQMGHLVFAGTVAFIFHKNAKVIQDTQILVDDVLLGSTGIVGSQDMQLFGTFGHFKHKLK